MTPNSSFTVAEKTMDFGTEKKAQYKYRVIWPTTIALTWLHVSALYGIYVGLTATSIKTLIFAIVYGMCGGIGVTAGHHRLWCHRGYKAHWALRVILTVFVSSAAQFDIYKWCKIHRVHHKFSDTNADPHNINRGFWFAHVGWLIFEEHPDVKEKYNTVFMDDVWADPIVRFQKRFYVPMVLVFAIYIPTMIPVWLWDENVWNALYVAAILRQCIILNITFFINSVAHTFGYKPYDKSMEARDSVIMLFLAAGEGYHNFHHAFPWDCTSSELGRVTSLATIFINWMTKLGLAYDLRIATKESVHKRAIITGDGSRHL